MVIAASTLLPAMLLSGQASGAQLTSRYVDLSSVQSSGGNSTEGSGRDGGDAFGQDVTYTVGFTVATTGNIGGVVVDFCSDSPITGTTCTAPAGFNSNFATLGIANRTGVTDWAVDTTNSTVSRVILTRTAASVAAATAVEFDLGTTAVADGFTNPTSNGSFYARIVTYAATATAQAYTSTVPGAFVDDGGIAMAIANELTISARVQEVLQFCVGSTYSGTSVPADDCTDISGTAINLGILDSASTTVTVAGTDGKAMIRTNANSGAVMYYKAEQNTASGKLKVAGATCSGVLLTDQCINSVGTTQAAITSGVENFGMALTGLTTANGTVATTLTCDAAYLSPSTCTAAPTAYAWDDTGSFDTIASSTSVLDDVLVNLRFAGTASATTPTGLYTVTANFVATATF